MSREDYIQSIIENSSRLKRLAMADRAKLDDLQLSRAQLELIHLLYFHEPVGSGKAAELLGVSKSAISQLADSLEFEDYIQRVNDQKDRRITYMSLTPKGKEVQRRLRRKMNSGLRAMIETLDDKEIETLCRIYQKMTSRVMTMDQKEKND